jgi:peptide/nickel transport system permease protein
MRRTIKISSHPSSAQQAPPLRRRPTRARLFLEVLYAGQISLKIGLGVGLISTIVGFIAGAIAGYFGRTVDNVLMRVTDLFLVVPAIALLAIALQEFGYSDVTIILVLAALFWMSVARVVRSQVLSLREKEFVEAARAAGATSNRIVIRHILPNMIGPLMVNATLSIAAAILTEATLSFLVTAFSLEVFVG